MSIIRQTAPTHHNHHETLGSYTRHGTQHQVVAARDHNGPWQLLDIAADDTITPIETLSPGEVEKDVRAIADIYLQEMRS